MRKPAFCICENKGEDHLHRHHAADQHFSFPYIDSTISLLPKSEISSLWPSMVVQPDLCRTWSETPNRFSRNEAHFTCSDVVVESDDILCIKNCKPYDVHCVHNKTKSISYQFLALPVIPKIYWPVVLLNITAQGFALVPQMYLYIYSGNDDGLFDTIVKGDTGINRTTSRENPVFGVSDQVLTQTRLFNHRRWLET